MLKLERVKKQYKNFTLDCSLEVRPGCITGLIGQNGAGKSTTFKAALGLIHTDGGTIEMLGKPERELQESDRQELGVVLLKKTVLFPDVSSFRFLWIRRSKSFPPE